MQGNFEETLLYYAENHRLINHIDEDGKRAFFVEKYENVLDGTFQNSLRHDGCSLILFEPVGKLASNESDGMSLNVHTGFAVICRSESMTSYDAYTANQTALSVTKEIITRLIRESREGQTMPYIFAQPDQNDYDIEPLFYQKDGYWFGYSILMKYTDDNFIEDSISNDNWADL